MKIINEKHGYELYCGDALELMDEVKGRANMVCCDPPYLLTSGGKGGNPKYDSVRMGGCFAASEYENKGNIVECDISWREIFNVFYSALERGHCYSMCNDKNIREMLNAADDVGFGMHNFLPWNKGTATPNRWYMKNNEFTGLFFKGKAFSINDCGSKQTINCPQIDVTDHPTEKPIALMQHYIENSTQRAQVVFDPFAGSGSTGVAAIRAGRKFIGIEKDEKWFNVMKERIEKECATAQAFMFDDAMLKTQTALDV